MKNFRNFFNKFVTFYKKIMKNFKKLNLHLKVQDGCPISYKIIIIHTSL